MRLLTQRRDGIYRFEAGLFGTKKQKIRLQSQGILQLQKGLFLKHKREQKVQKGTKANSASLSYTHS
jgi:hypothetical protein